MRKLSTTARLTAMIAATRRRTARGVSGSAPGPLGCGGGGGAACAVSVCDGLGGAGRGSVDGFRRTVERLWVCVRFARVRRKEVDRACAVIWLDCI